MVDKGGVVRLRVVIGAVLAAIAVSVVVAHRRHERFPWSPATPPGAPFTELVAKVRGGILQVETACNGYDRRGTGFLVAPQLLATVLHVVNGADTVVLKQDGAQVATGAVIGRDFQNDLALVRLDRPLPGFVFTVSGESATEGQAVGAAGFPLGQDGLTAARGIVVGGGRRVDLNGIERSGMIEVQLAVDHGDSGEPVFDLESGDVVGLVDAGPRHPNGFGLAVDSRLVRPFIDQWTATPLPVQGASC